MMDKPRKRIITDSAGEKFFETEVDDDVQDADSIAFSLILVFFIIGGVAWLFWRLLWA